MFLKELISEVFGVIGENLVNFLMSEMFNENWYNGK